MNVRGAPYACGGCGEPLPMQYLSSFWRPPPGWLVDWTGGRLEWACCDACVDRIAHKRDSALPLPDIFSVEDLSALTAEETHVLVLKLTGERNTALLAKEAAEKNCQWHWEQCLDLADEKVAEKLAEARRERDEALRWDDGPLPEDEQIRAAYPTRSGSHKQYAEAMRLVGARRSKGGLVALVNWLLVRAERAP